MVEMENKQITLFKVLLNQLEELDKTRKINPKLIKEGRNLVKSFKTKRKKEKQEILHTISEYFWGIKHLIRIDKFYQELSKEKSIKFDTFESWNSLNFFCLGIDFCMWDIDWPISILTNKETINIYRKKLDTYKNKIGKQWREELYLLAGDEYSTNKILDKKKALLTAFEKLPDKEKYRKEFDLNFESIYRSFLKFIPFDMFDALGENPYFGTIFEKLKTKAPTVN